MRIGNEERAVADRGTEQKGTTVAQKGKDGPETAPSPSQKQPKSISLKKLLARSGFTQGTKFSFLTEADGPGPINPNVAKGSGSILIAKDSLARIRLDGEIVLGDTAKWIAEKFGGRAIDREFLREQIGVYPGQPDKDGKMLLSFEQEFKVLNHKDIILSFKNKLPDLLSDSSRSIFPYFLRPEDNPELWIGVGEAGVIGKVAGDQGVELQKMQRGLIKFIFGEKNKIVQEAGLIEYLRNKKTKQVVGDFDDDIAGFTTIEKT